MLKKSYWYILAVIPVVYLLAGFYFNHLIGIFSLRNMDPEYIYFLSGLGIANGHFHLGHFDNPGTPLQILIALTYRIVYWFRPHETPFMEDVFRNSDLYLNMANHLVLLIIAVILYLCGMKIYKITGKIAYALLIQTAPFYSEITYDIIGRLVPELLIPLPVLILSLILLKYLFEENYLNQNKPVIFLALTTAFGLSVKMSFLPFWLIPLFIIPGWEKKLWYVVISFLAFLIFALPATLEYKTFWIWLKDLFLHSENYGKGEVNILNPRQFIENINEIWKSTSTLFYLLGILVLTGTGYLFFRRNGRNDNRILRISSGVLLAVLFQLALSSKHYSYRYIIPSLAMIPLLAILSFELLNRISPRIGNKYFILLITLLAFIPGTKKQVISAEIRSKGIGEEMAAKRQTWHYVQAIPDSCVKIIVTQGYGAPFQDYVIMYSTAWGGPRMKDYRGVLSKLYPYTYQYNTWDDKLQTFGEPFNPKKLASSKKPVILYLEHDTPELMQRTMKKLFQQNDSVDVIKKLIFSNLKTSEGLYLLIVSPAAKSLK